MSFNQQILGRSGQTINELFLPFIQQEQIANFPSTRMYLHPSGLELRPEASVDYLEEQHVLLMDTPIAISATPGKFAILHSFFFVCFRIPKLISLRNLFYFERMSFVHPFFYFTSSLICLLLYI